MDMLPLFCMKCEAVMSAHGRSETEWYDSALQATVNELKKLPLNLSTEKGDSVETRLRSLELLLSAWLVANKGIDARASAAWRAAGEELGFDYLTDLAPIEDKVVDELLVLTGHQKQSKLGLSRMKALKVAGAVVIGGGIMAAGGALAAPILGTALASAGATATGAFLMSSGGIAAVAGLFGAYGANRTGWKMVKELEEDDDDEGTETGLLVSVEAKPNHPSQALHCLIGVSGWLLKDDLKQQSAFWAEATSLPGTESWALVFDRKVLEDYGNALHKFVFDQAVQSAILHAIVFAGGHLIMAAATPPVTALMLQDIVDSPFAVAKNRAKLAGEELARALSQRAFGNRPITLVGYGFGSTAIVTCLETLARSSKDVEGLVQDVVLFGSPIRISPERWKSTTRIVAGRYVNCYCAKDRVLFLLMRLSTKTFPTAGVQPINIPGIEDKAIESTAYEVGTTPSLVQTYLVEILSTKSAN